MRAFIFILMTLFFVCVQESSCADVLSVKHSGYFVHQVQRGQSLSLISKLYFGDFSRVSSLKSINGLRSDVILVGQRLKIPKFEVLLSVTRGDTLSKLSQEYFCGASRYKRLASLNRVNKPYGLEVGQKLKIPLCKSFFQAKTKKPRAKQPKSRIHKKYSKSKLFDQERYSKKLAPDPSFELRGVKAISEGKLDSSRLVRTPFVYELDELRYVPKLSDSKPRQLTGSPLDFAKSKSYESTYMKEIAKPIHAKRDRRTDHVDFIPHKLDESVSNKPTIIKRRVRRKNRFKGENNIILDPALVDKSMKLIRSSKRKNRVEKVVFGRTNTRTRRRKQKVLTRLNTKNNILKPYYKTYSTQRTDRKEQPDSVEGEMNLFGLSSAQNAGVELFSNIKESYKKSQVVSSPPRKPRHHGVRGLFSSLGRLQGSSGNWDRRDLYSDSIRRTVSIGVETYSISPKQSDFGVGKINSASMPLLKASKPLGRGGEISFLTGSWTSKSTDNQIKTTLDSKYSFQGFSMSTTELFGRNMGLRLELGLMQASNELHYSDTFGFSFASKDKGLFVFASSAVRYRISRDLEFSLSLAHFGGKFNHSSLVSTQSQAPLDLSDTAIGFGLHYRF
ncbi:MAG: LysM peptidoglycan-binding domain-containing protein [Candidatus Cloacimonetes bacterium]|nr:LysM peptidoglycan-binding domain-containing protein [Candidatus Cloacimonadota bacterium]